MPVKNLIIDPPITSSLSQRLMCGIQSNRASAGVLALNSEYTQEALKVFSDDNYVYYRDIDNELLLTTDNLKNPDRFNALLASYITLNRIQSESQKNGLVSKTLLTLLLKILLVESNDKPEGALIVLAKLSNSKTHDESIKKIDKTSKYFSDKSDQNLIEAIQKSGKGEISSKLNSAINFLWHIHKRFALPFVPKRGRHKALSPWIDQKKLIWFPASILTHSTYFKLLSLFSAHCKELDCFMDSETPNDFLQSLDQSVINVDKEAPQIKTITLSELDKSLYGYEAEQCENFFSSMQLSDQKTFMAWMARKNFDFIQKNKFSINALSSMIDTTPYSDFTGVYISFVKGSLVLVSVNRETGKINQKKFPASILVERTNLENQESEKEASIVQTSHASPESKETLERIDQAIKKLGNISKEDNLILQQIDKLSNSLRTTTLAVKNVHKQVNSFQAKAEESSKQSQELQQKLSNEVKQSSISRYDSFDDTVDRDKSDKEIADDFMRQMNNQNAKNKDNMFKNLT